MTILFTKVVTMSKAKCPLCGGEMIGGGICHYNPDCPIHDNPVPTEVLELLDRTKTQLALYKDFADSAKRTLDGSNNMIKSWHKLLQSDYAAETKCRILNQAISAYVEEREKHALKGLDNE